MFCPHRPRQSVEDTSSYSLSATRSLSHRLSPLNFGFGVARSKQPFEGAARLRLFLSKGIEVLPFAPSDAEAAARIRAALEQAKQSIGPFDTLIAGQALARNLTLVTSNTREFSRVEGLKWEDWS
jgi:tRNA(fMet)-specific endonuclease VapC